VNGGVGRGGGGKIDHQEGSQKKKDAEGPINYSVETSPLRSTLSWTLIISNRSVCALTNNIDEIN
jgi:hypothetical protein